MWGGIITSAKLYMHIAEEPVQSTNSHYLTALTDLLLRAKLVGVPTLLLPAILGL